MDGQSKQLSMDTYPNHSIAKVAIIEESIKEPKLENFQIVNGMNVPVGNDATQKLTTGCPNSSLNEMHKTGSIEKQPFQTSCKTETADEAGAEKFYQKFKPYVSYDQENGIQGANYFMYNNNPNPYKLDFTLYDKDAPANTPVGVNYV